MNNTGISSTSNAAQLGVVLTESSERRPITYSAMLCAALWNAARDGSATMVASLITLGGAIGVRAMLVHVPVLRHGVMVLTAGINFAAGATFGSHVGAVVAGRRGGWIGGAVGALAVVTLTVVAIYRRDEEGQELVIAGLFATMAYSGLREAVQGKVLKPRLPSSTLQAGKSLRWENSRNTHSHVCRLAMHFGVYAVTCTLLNGMASRNVVSPNFGSLGQPLELFSRESISSFGFRSTNEALDAFSGTLLLACMFRQDIDIQPNCCEGKTPSWSDWWREASSRIFMNANVAGITWLLPPSAPLWLGSMLTSVTAIRGALANVKPPIATRADGDCLLHAAAGTLQNEEWICADPGEIRERLRARLEELADDDNAPYDDRVRVLVDHHMGQAIQQLSSTVYGSVLEGEALLEGMPHSLEWTTLRRLDSADARTSLAVRLLNDSDNVRALLRSVANYYGTPGRYLPTSMVPFLAEVLQRPITLEAGNTTTHYNGQGRVVQQPADGTVRIRFTVSSTGDAGNHFERIMPQASFDEPLALASEDEREMVLFGEEEEKKGDDSETGETVPLNGHGGGQPSPRSRNR